MSLNYDLLFVLDVCRTQILLSLLNVYTKLFWVYRTVNNANQDAQFMYQEI